MIARAPLAGWRILTAIALALVCTPAMAAGEQATAGGRARASVVERVAVVQLSALYSGPVATGRRGACRRTTGCRLAQPASFDLRGEPERSYQVTAPQAVNFRGESTQTAGEISLSAIEVRTDSLPGEGDAGRIGIEGSDRFGVGATLHLPATVASGRYAGNFRVVVAYD